MIRVLQLGMVCSIGGIQTFLMNYYRNIDRSKIQFDFVNIYDEDFLFKNEIENYGGKIYDVSSYYRHPFKYIKEVEKIINDNNYEIIHCNMNSAAMFWPLIVAKKSKAKVIISHAHNSSSDKGPIKAIMHNTNKHFIPAFANNYFACSNMAGKWFFNSKIREGEKYHVINNAVDLENFKYNEEIRNKIRKELNIGEDELVIGHVGRYSKQKNHDFLIDIFNKVYEKNEKSKLVLIGEGSLMGEIKEKINRLDLTKNVIILGNKDNVNEYMQGFDAFLLPSLYEGLPVVGVEAQASGLACYFSNTITDELNLLETSKFISLNTSPSEWANVILETYSNVDRSRGYEDITKMGYNIKVEAKKLEKMYEELLGE